MGNQSSTSQRTPLLLDGVVVDAGADGNVSLGSARPLSTDLSSVELFFTESLVEMGIDRDLAARAVAATRGESLIAAVDWVFNHRPLDRAPSPAARDEARTWPARPTAPAPLYRVLRRVANNNTSTIGSFPSTEAYSKCNMQAAPRRSDEDAPNRAVSAPDSEHDSYHSAQNDDPPKLAMLQRTPSDLSTLEISPEFERSLRPLIMPGPLTCARAFAHACALVNSPHSPGHHSDPNAANRQDKADGRRLQLRARTPRACTPL